MQVAWGYDKIILAYQCRVSPAFLAELAAAKLAAADHRNGPQVLHGWEVASAGTSKGGKGGPKYAFFLQMGFMDLQIANVEESRNGFSNVIATFGAVALTQQGDAWCFGELAKLWELAGVTVEVETLSQVDVSLDYPGVGVWELQNQVALGAYVARAHKVDNVQVRTHEQKSYQTGISVGRGNVLRIYDKIREVRVQSPEKKGMMIDCRWGGEYPDCATRVEMQIRREHLKELWNVKSFADFDAMRRRVMRFYLLRWFKITEQVPDRANKNQSRCVVFGLWRSMVDAAMVALDERDAVRPAIRSEVDLEQLKAGAMGYLQSLAVKSGFAGSTVEDGFMGVMQHVLWEYLQQNRHSLEVKLREKEVKEGLARRAG